MGNRLKELRSERGWTHDRAAEAMAISRGQYIKLERGERRLTLDYIDRAAKAFSVDPTMIISEGGTVVSVPVVGRAGAGPSGEVIFDAEQQVLEEVPAPPGATRNTVGLGVQGDSMRGIANDGWLIFYDDRHFPPTDEMLGELCVVGTAGGQTLVKFLAPGRGPGLYDLESYNAPTLRDEPVEWAALVTSIIPRKPARRMMAADPTVGTKTARTR
jgi:transcriptional regulator with XRE-family HTH domain